MGNVRYVAWLSEERQGMLKSFFLKLLNIVAKGIIFPASRWYNSNFFLYSRKNPWLKERPSLIWLIFGRLFMKMQIIIKKACLFYREAVVKNYTCLSKRHYCDNYAYGDDILLDIDYKERFADSPGLMRALLNNAFLMRIAEIKDTDSFLECGCGLGSNIKDIVTSFPAAKVTAFDLSPNAVKFAKDVFEGEAVRIFQGSALDADIWNGFPDKSIDNVFFANMLATVLSGSIAQTRQARSRIISEAVRIARKNVIIFETLVSYENIYIEQKYRAIFYDDYTAYFEGLESQGGVLITPRILIFHKK